MPVWRSALTGGKRWAWRLAFAIVRHAGGVEADFSASAKNDSHR
jgi:hypothetical protein